MRLQWVQKNKTKAGSIATEIAESSTTSLTGLYNTDIRTRLVGVNVSIFKNDIELIVIELASITDININGSKVIVSTDDRGPLTLQFLNNNEANLAFDKFLAAGNGEVV